MNIGIERHRRCGGRLGDSRGGAESRLGYRRASRPAGRAAPSLATWAIISTLLIPACAGNPEHREQRREELAIWKAEFADARRACRRNGGYIVQYPPAVGGRYQCAR